MNTGPQRKRLTTVRYEYNDSTNTLIRRVFDTTAEKYLGEFEVVMPLNKLPAGLIPQAVAQGVEKATRGAANLGADASLKSQCDAARERWNWLTQPGQTDWEPTGTRNSANVTLLLEAFQRQNPGADMAQVRSVVRSFSPEEVEAYLERKDMKEIVAQIKRERVKNVNTDALFNKLAALKVPTLRVAQAS